MSRRKSHESDFRTILNGISHRDSSRRTFEAFTRLAACALAAQTREAEYLEESKRWEKPELDLFAKALGALVMEMETRPFEDLLGAHYMEFGLSQKSQQRGGEFHTPKVICDLMARMIVGDGESLPAEGPITICEPACGAGAMILSFAEACPPEVRRRLRVMAIDICRTACDMAFINTTLWGIPTRIIHGNALSMECWAAWSNIHYICPWLSLAPMHRVSAMSLPGPRSDIGQGEPPKPAEVKRLRVALSQQELTF